jgi:DNA-binding CsgD family transcriptional regulator/tetratricopeptide (TPR) repeat protein
MHASMAAVDIASASWDDAARMLAVSQDETPLFGRDAEIEHLTGLLDAVEHSGGALVLRGEPGIGKSRLLAEAAALARQREMTVLTMSGVQSEANLAFAGLEQLLRPVRFHSDRLSPEHQAVLDPALSVGEGDAPERFRIALAVLDLLSEVATDHPLLLIAEDAHWLDQPSVDVLGFVARRLESEPIVLLAATREGYPTAFSSGELPELRLQPLGPEPATRLLEGSRAHLSAIERTKILREAAGNPLALVELPSIADRLDNDHLIPGLFPLTQRLERAFATRAAELPAETQLLLLVVALNDGARLGEVLEAGDALSEEPVAVEMLQKAADVAIVALDERSVRFRHPLMRSAVSQAAPVESRRKVHEALTKVLSDQPDRRVWHRAALISGQHEAVAVELEETAARARRRGAIGVAVIALRRAADLSAPERRISRLLAAAASAFEMGQADVVVPLLREADRLDPGPIERARITWIGEAVNTIVHIRPLGGARPARSLIQAAEEAGQAGDRDLHVDILWLAALRASWSGLDPATSDVLREAAARVGPPDPDDPRVFLTHVYADPFSVPPESMEKLRAMVADRSYAREGVRHLGSAAFNLGAFEVADPLIREVVDLLRDGGQLGYLPQMLTLLGIVAARLADWNTAIPAAEETRRLAAELGEPQWGGGGDAVESLIAGMRGNDEAADRASARAEQIGLEAQASVVQALALPGRVLSALGASRHEEAFATAERLFDPDDPAHHPSMRCWLIGDLAEAAVNTDRREHGLRRLAEVEALVGEHPETWVALELRYARALLEVESEAATAAFDKALSADLSRWPFQRGRLLLAHGRWLRRERRVTESRVPLRAARDIFDALGCAAWADQTRRELRASGESSRRRDPALRDQLTAQELQIAQLAAEGLSNREIGQKLFVSPRTVSTHLYRLYPKLGISGRGELAAVLSDTA